MLMTLYLWFTASVSQRHPRHFDVQKLFIVGNFFHFNSIFFIKIFHGLFFTQLFLLCVWNMIFIESPIVCFLCCNTNKELALYENTL